MIRNAFLSIALLAAAGIASAQVPGEARGPAAGSTDGSRPADGAINGGSILPGETGGIPSSRGPVAPSDGAVQRCYDLVGSLREDCLLKQRGASTGATRAPSGAGANVEREVTPRIDPPPQNPR